MAAQSTGAPRETGSAERRSVLDSITPERAEPEADKAQTPQQKVSAMKQDGATGIKLITVLSLVIPVLLVVLAVSLWFVNPTAAIIVGLIAASSIVALLLWKATAKRRNLRRRNPNARPNVRSNDMRNNYRRRNPFSALRNRFGSRPNNAGGGSGGGFSGNGNGRNQRGQRNWFGRNRNRPTGSHAGRPANSSPVGSTGRATGNKTGNRPGMSNQNGRREGIFRRPDGSSRFRRSPHGGTSNTGGRYGNNGVNSRGWRPWGSKSRAGNNGSSGQNTGSGGTRGRSTGNSGSGGNTGRSWYKPWSWSGGRNQPSNNRRNRGQRVGTSGSSWYKPWSWGSSGSNKNSGNAGGNGGSNKPNGGNSGNGRSWYKPWAWYGQRKTNHGGGQQSTNSGSGSGSNGRERWSWRGQNGGGQPEEKRSWWRSRNRNDDSNPRGGWFGKRRERDNGSNYHGADGNASGYTGFHNSYDGDHKRHYGNWADEYWNRGADTPTHTRAEAERVDNTATAVGPSPKAITGNGEEMSESRSPVAGAATGRREAQTHVESMSGTHQSTVDHVELAARCRRIGTMYAQSDDRRLSGLASLWFARAAQADVVAANRAQLTAGHAAAASQAANG